MVEVSVSVTLQEEETVSDGCPVGLLLGLDEHVVD